MVLTGEVNERGQLKFTQDERAAVDARLLELVGQRVACRFDELEKTRSARANAYYWSQVLAPMAASQPGMTDEEVHDAMCERYLPNERKRVDFFNRMTGEVLEIECDGRRSSKLNGGKFYDFVELVRLFALEFLGVQTEDPDPEYWRKRFQSRAASEGGKDEMRASPP